MYMSYKSLKWLIAIVSILLVIAAFVNIQYGFAVAEHQSLAPYLSEKFNYLWTGNSGLVFIFIFFAGSLAVFLFAMLFSSLSASSKK